MIIVSTASQFLGLASALGTYIYILLNLLNSVIVTRSPNLHLTNAPFPVHRPIFRVPCEYQFHHCATLIKNEEGIAGVEPTTFRSKYDELLSIVALSRKHLIEIFNALPLSYIPSQLKTLLLLNFQKTNLGGELGSNQRPLV